jgi:anti-sigma-K factor RskA
VSAHDSRFDDATAAYLLGALEPDEAKAFEAHLTSCAACRGELDHLKVAADALPSGVPQYSAPPALEDRIMAVVRSEAELLRAAGPEADVARRAGARSGARRRRPWFARPAFALAATVLVLAVGALGGITLFGGADTRELQAQLAPQGARVLMTVREGSEHATLVARGLPEAGEGRVYQVWLKSGAADPRPTNALFSPSADGSASVDVPSSLEGVDDVLVTSEPDGGSRAPTRQPVITVSTA